MTLTNIGNLMHLYMIEITLKEGIDAPEFLIKTAAQYLRSNNHNWVPIIVKEVEEDKYEVIGNSYVYAVAEAAKLEKVWCIIADTTRETDELTKILAGEKTPKINLSTATIDDIKAALQYLIEKPGSFLKGVNLLIAATRIDTASDRKYWKNLEPITKLKCGITASKLEALAEAFYLTPEPEPVLDLKSLTVTELKDLAKQRGIKGYSKKKKSALIELLS